MPIYQYQPVSRDCKRCEGVFEVHQRVADDKLAACPTCGQAVERRISAPALGGKYSTSDAAVKASGLTKYKKVGNGQYERTVGSGGPETLDRGSK
jgi:putative FmdB family regulatory protein